MKKVRAVLSVMVELEVPVSFTDEDVEAAFNELDYNFTSTTEKVVVSDTEIRDLVLTQRA